MGIPQYTGASDDTVPAQPRPPMPDTVRKAIRMMHIGVWLGMLGVVAVSVLNAFTLAGQNGSARSTAALELAVGLVEGAVVAGLWFWMAKACGNGRNWGRVVSTVLFGLYCAQEVEVGAADTLRTHAFPVSMVLGLPMWIIGLVAVVLLWNRKSSPYFR